MKRSTARGFEVFKRIIRDNWRYKIEMRGLPNYRDKRQSEVATR